MINHITKFTTNAGKYHYQVFYNNGRKFTYMENDNLPNTVLNLILNGTCETKYTAFGKVETYREA